MSVMTVASTLATNYSMDFRAAKRAARKFFFGGRMRARELQVALCAQEPGDIHDTDSLRWGDAFQPSEGLCRELNLVPAGFVSRCKGKLPVKESAQLARVHALETFKGNVTQRYRFKQSARERGFWLAVGARVEPSTARWQSMLNCGASWFVKQSKVRPGVFRSEISTCENRLCPACSKRLGQERADSITERLQGLDAAGLSFVTLTLKHRDAPLKDQMQFLRASFRRIRQMKRWQRYITWGVAVMEIKMGRDGLWHPHLHLVCRAGFYPFDDLKSDWYAASRGSSSVYIERVSSHAQAVHYVAKYISKPCSGAGLGWDINQGCELYIAIARAKLSWEFGDKDILPPKPKRDESPGDPEAHDQWVIVATVAELLKAAKQGDDQAWWVADQAGIPLGDIVNHTYGGIP